MRYLFSRDLTCSLWVGTIQTSCCWCVMYPLTSVPSNISWFPKSSKFWCIFVYSSCTQESSLFSSHLRHIPQFRKENPSYSKYLCFLQSNHGTIPDQTEIFSKECRNILRFLAQPAAGLGGPLEHLPLSRLEGYTACCMHEADINMMQSKLFSREVCDYHCYW